jgi:hypothetical protein
MKAQYTEQTGTVTLGFPWRTRRVCVNQGEIPGCEWFFTEGEGLQQRSFSLIGGTCQDPVKAG